MRDYPLPFEGIHAHVSEGPPGIQFEDHEDVYTTVIRTRDGKDVTETIVKEAAARNPQAEAIIRYLAEADRIGHGGAYDVTARDRLN